MNPSLLARALNRIRICKGKEPLTSDLDIIRRRWLLIDCDAQRPAGISATKEEHEAAMARAREIFAYLREDCWPDPIAADSGNGAHLLYRLDLPAEDGGLLSRVLLALSHRFDDDAVKVDTGVFNPARIWKMYGTLACKGDSTPDRPHRIARILSAPDTPEIVSQELLEALAGTAIAKVKEPPRKEIKPHDVRFDLDSFIAKSIGSGWTRAVSWSRWTWTEMDIPTFPAMQSP